MKIKKRDLEDILFPHKLNHSRHDELIKTVNDEVELVYHALPVAMNAYYKIADNAHKGGFLESDIDLLMLNYDHQNDYFDSWKEVPFGDSTLLLFEMKTHDTASQYKKALYQLTRSKNMLLDYTHYQSVRTMYCFWSGKQDVIRVEEI